MAIVSEYSLLMNNVLPYKVFTKILSNFENKLLKKRVPFPLENRERGEYEEMLYNPKPFWE